MEALLAMRVAPPPAPAGDYRPDLVTPGFDDRTLRTPLLVQQTDIPALVAEQLELLRGEVTAALRQRRADRESAAHLASVQARLDRLLR